jgi:hypothetical protein
VLSIFNTPEKRSPTIPLTSGCARFASHRIRLVPRTLPAIAMAMMIRDNKPSKLCDFTTRGSWS